MSLTTTIARRAVLSAAVALLGFWFPITATAQDAPPPAPPAAQAAPEAPQAPPPAGLVTLAQADSGQLLLKTIYAGQYLPAPTVAADVQIDITGPLIRTRVTQRFENPSDQWVEGTYTYPLPEDAAVDRLRLLVGDRFIEGQIKEREEARQIYETARREGRRAGLVEQQRPNMFTNSVANIGPGETVVVQIEYQETARLSNGVFSTRFPMVVGPRYIPAPDLVQVVDFDGQTGIALTNPVPDAGAVTPPVRQPEFEPGLGPDGAVEDADALRLPVFIRADLRAGFSLGTIESRHHAVNIERTGDGRALIALREQTPANKDFVLEWRASDGRTPQAALFRETWNDALYALAMVTPPASLSADAPRQPREAIFVIDNSGSMAGPSMAQAKEALLLALDRLELEDSFNVIRFDDTYDLAFTAPVPATPENVAFAKGLVSALEANGGTEMLPALQQALIDAASDDERVRQVVFLTDGAIGNEAQLFQAIQDGLGRSRLFTVGIGSAPNSYFMTRAARMGRGTFTYIADVSEVAEKASELFQALERPVMTDLSADIVGGRVVEAYPQPLPDLYQGEPVVVVLRGAQAGDTLRVSGSLAGQRWAADLTLAQAANGPGVAGLWGRAKIADIEESRLDGADFETVDAGVLTTALNYGLVSRRSSLVAVDVTPARPADEPLTTREIANMLPEGWDFGAVFGEEPQRFQREAALDLADPRLAALRDPRNAEQILRTAEGLALPRGGLLDSDRGILAAVQNRLQTLAAQGQGVAQIITSADISRTFAPWQLIVSGLLFTLGGVLLVVAGVSLRRKLKRPQ